MLTLSLHRFPFCVRCKDASQINDATLASLSSIFPRIKVDNFDSSFASITDVSSSSSSFDIFWQRQLATLYQAVRTEELL